ncbi:hypothetical protein SAMN05192580_3224 [Sphingomonas jatrophae]|uniref:Uncharacterized protein n=1 Tax=Sphingomonas jatrophae TaxID=1166337 RepID=A0A1I6M084_9SPHN|nr:hypothetical protein SAMN05192580_3224 [Sphingomonas jatrophae]
MTYKNEFKEVLALVVEHASPLMSTKAGTSTTPAKKAAKR